MFVLLERASRRVACAIGSVLLMYSSALRAQDAGSPADTLEPSEAGALDEGLLDQAALEEAPLDEVVVTVRRSSARTLQRSAEAVNVIDTRKAQQQTADLGEVLARTQGIVIRRDGGLGSEARFSLNGLYDDQIRFFLDGVPLELAGYPFGIANVPVNLVERVEVYRGVVPVRFGADALGGAVNLVSDQSLETRAGFSYQLGSYGTHRVTLDGQFVDEPTGIFAGGAVFLDLALNNYDVDVEVPDRFGRLSPATVPRFHDAYLAYGLTAEVGIADQSWARRLSLRGFVSTYDKELQHNVVMAVPYGEVEYGEAVYGGTARYDVELGQGFELELIANHARRTIDFVDDAEWVYDWFGERNRARRIGGEIESDPTDQTTWHNGTFGRATLTWLAAPEHTLRASVASAFATRTGDERLQADPAARDPLTAKRDLFTVVSGVEHELNVLDKRLANIFFVKDYVYRASTEESLAGGIFRARDTDTHDLGVGDSLRLHVLPWLYAKASYEYATRLPRPDEVFGDGVLIVANLELEREVSHNANLGPRIELKDTPSGDWLLDVNAFLRESDRLIVLLGNDRVSSFHNIYKARGLGLEHAVGWTSPGAELVSLDGTLTYQRVTNASSEGTFGTFEGDPIPNRPYLFGSWGARLKFLNMPGANDTLEPFYNGRYVHEFFRGWQSQGLRQFKAVIDAQVTHSAGITWVLDREWVHETLTFEIDNLTGVKVFDNFGVQRPGRAFYLKITGEL